MTQRETYPLSPSWPRYGMTVKVPELVMTILPVIASLGTVAVTWVSELTEKVVAAPPPKLTPVVLGQSGNGDDGSDLALVGEKLLMVGGTLKALELMADPRSWNCDCSSLGGDLRQSR